MKFGIVCRSVVAGLIALLPIAATSSAEDVARLDAALKSYADDRQFMGAVQVTAGDKTLLDKGYGFANLEWNVPNTPNTKFRIGSVTKQFTAAAVFLLQERGKLSIHDPLKKYVPDVPAAWGDVTIYHLLTHSSGVPNFTDLPEYWTRRVSPATPDQLIDLVHSKPLDFPPGTKWNYSNTGYDLLGMIIGKVSGQSYATFLTENFFKPLGMNDTGYDKATTILPHRASGYEREKDGLQNADYVDTSVLFSAGALYSTTHDLAAWEQALFAGKVLSSSSLKKMTSPYIATAMAGADYGCGLFIQKIGGHTVVSHPGFIDGFTAELVYVPDRKMTIVVLANVSGPEPTMWATMLAKTVLGEMRAPK